MCRVERSTLHRTCLRSLLVKKVVTETLESENLVRDEAAGCECPTALPAWLQNPQNYEPRSDNERFLHKNMSKLAGVLSSLKLQRGGLESEANLSLVERALAHVDSAYRLLGLLSTIVCVSAAANMFFVYAMLGVFLLLMAMMPGSRIVDVLKPALGACAFSALIMLPAFFLGQSESLVRVALKVFLCVGFVINLSRGTAYNDLIAGLRAYHVPGLVIFILDITLKYIVMLGEVAMGVLESLRLRSVGKNDDKRGSSSGVLGITFLKAHDYAAEMYEAMECRGFTGEYVVAKRHRFNAAAGVYLALIVLECVCFFFLEGFI